MASASAVSALLRAYRPQVSSAPEQAAYAVNLVLLADGFELVEAGRRAEDAFTSGSPRPPSAEDPLATWQDTPGVYSFLYSFPAAPREAEAEAAAQSAEASADGARAGAGTGEGARAGAAGSAPGAPLAMLKCLVVGDTMMVDACRAGGREQGAAAAPDGAAAAAADAGAGAGPGVAASSPDESGRKSGEAQPQVFHAEFSIPEFVTTSNSSAASFSLRNLGGLVGLVHDRISQPLLQGSVPAVATGKGDEGRAAGAGTRAEGAASVGRQGQGASTERSGIHMEDQGFWGRPSPVPGIGYPPLPREPGFGDDLTPGGGAGIGPGREGPRFPGSGMLVGPDDPRWGSIRPGPGLEDPDSEYFYQGRPGNVPPGARFDPYGPPGVPGFEPGRFGDGGSRRRGPPGGLHGDLPFFP